MYLDEESGTRYRCSIRSFACVGNSATIVDTSSTFQCDIPVFGENHGLSTHLLGSFCADGNHSFVIKVKSNKVLAAIHDEILELAQIENVHSIDFLDL